MQNFYPYFIHTYVQDIEEIIIDDSLYNTDGDKIKVKLNCFEIIRVVPVESSAISFPIMTISRNTITAASWI